MPTDSTFTKLMRQVSRRIPVLAILVVSTMGLTGCYTQLAVMERPHGDIDQVVADYGDDGDILVRRYYEDGYVEEEVYNEYDWYYHRPYSYARYFDSFYGPTFGMASYCWDLFYCDPYWGYSSGFSLTMGYGSFGHWNRPYASFGFGHGWGYDPFHYGSYYRPYSHFPTYAWYGSGSGYYNYGGVRVASTNYSPRGETMARSALTSRTRGTRGGRDLEGIAGGRSTLGSSASALGTRTVVNSGRAGSTASKGLATGTRPSRGTLTGDRSARTTIGSTRSTTRSTVGSTRSSTSVGNTRSTTRTTRSAIGSRWTGSSTNSRATTRTSRTTGSRAYPSRTTTRTSSGVGRSTSTRSSGVGRSTGSSTRSSGVGRSTSTPTRSSGVGRSSSSPTRSSGVSRSSGSSSRSSGARSSGSSSSSSRSSGRSSSRSGRNN